MNINGYDFTEQTVHTEEVRLYYLLSSLELLVAPVHLALNLDALLADHLDPHPPTVLLLQGSLAAVPSRVVSLQSKVYYKSMSVDPNWNMVD
jgi:hypothetical protein